MSVTFPTNNERVHETIKKEFGESPKSGGSLRLSRLYQGRLEREGSNTDPLVPFLHCPLDMILVPKTLSDYLLVVNHLNGRSVLSSSSPIDKLGTKSATKRDTMSKVTV